LLASEWPRPGPRPHEIQADEIVIEMYHQLNISNLPAQMTRAGYITRRCDTRWRLIQSRPWLLCRNGGNACAYYQTCQYHHNAGWFQLHVALL